MPKRVLLASMDVGGGHRALRDSLHEALVAADPDAAEFTLNRFDSRNRSVDRFYSACVRHLPALQGSLWRWSEQDGLARWAIATAPALVSEARDALLASGCELLIATHPLLALAFARARAGLPRPPLLISAIPDYGAPTTFFHPETNALRADHLLVFSEEARAPLAARGVPRERLHLSGFRTHPAFRLAAQDRAERDRATRWRTLAAELPELRRLFPHRRTALVLGGSGWAARTWPVLERVLARPALAETMNLAVICGRDASFAARLRARTAGRRGIAVFDFLPRPALAALMAVSDVPLLGSLAPATLHELLEVGLGPLLVFRVIPGAEPPHLGYLERERLGLYEPNPARMVQVLEQATRHPAEGTWAALAEGFPARARAVRTLSLARAAQLPEVLRAILGGPRAVRAA